MEMETDIYNKRILFLSPAFFSYEFMIADKMRQMGAIVDMYDVRSIKSAFNRALLKVMPSMFTSYSKKYYETIISNSNKEYDYILIVKCDMTPISILEKFRIMYPKAKLCLYLWDSVNNIPGIVEKFKYFDALHSFDPNDCQKYPCLKFRPLFYGDEFNKTIGKNDYRYDISFLGTVHSDRYRVISKIQEFANKNDLNCFWFLYLQSRFIYYYYRLTKKEFWRTSPDTFSYAKMSSLDIARIVDESRVIVDIQHPNQTGLTMRTIEMIGMRKKIITTNPTIVDYDFYNVNNILVIDRNDFSISLEFINSPYQSLPSEVYENYSLENWILEVLS